jgi:hypothetical protein
VEGSGNPPDRGVGFGEEGRSSFFAAKDEAAENFQKII